MATILLVVSAVLAGVNAIPYIIEVLKGQTRPRLVSWFVWMLLAIIMTGANLRAGESATAMLTAATAVACTVTLVLGFKYSDKRMTRLDVACLAGALLGMAAWLLTDNPAIALFIAVGVDILAYIPTLKHGWEAPEEESLLAFGLSAVGSAAGLIGVVMAGGAWTGLVYPIYAATFNGLMALILVAGRASSGQTDTAYAYLPD